MYFAEDHVKQITVVTLAFTMDTGNTIPLYIKDFVVFVPVHTNILVPQDMLILHSILLDKPTDAGEEVSLEQNLLQKVCSLT